MVAPQRGENQEMGETAILTPDTEFLKDTNFITPFLNFWKWPLSALNKLDNDKAGNTR